MSLTSFRRSGTLIRSENKSPASVRHVLEFDLDAFKASYLADEEFDATPPPVEEVTMLSDDYTSVSSVDSPSLSSTASNTRSIFRDYWSRNGGKPHGSKRRLPETVSVRKDFEVRDEPRSAGVSYEQVLKENEGVCVTTHSPPRRVIFGSYPKSPSVPVFSTSSVGWPNFRKTQSEGLLLSTEKVSSCLRPTRYSGSYSRRTSIESSTQSVRFTDEDSVAVYNAPKERWACDGWSQYFH
jgi:hypothetical protein